MSAGAGAASPANPGTKMSLAAPARQCAAVITRFPPAEWITEPVQTCRGPSLMKMAPTRLSGSTGPAAALCWGWLSRCASVPVATGVDTIGRPASSAGRVHDVSNVARPTPELSNSIGMRIWCTSCLTTASAADHGPAPGAGPWSAGRHADYVRGLARFQGENCTELAVSLLVPGDSGDTGRAPWSNPRKEETPMAHAQNPDDEFDQPGQSGMYELEFPAPQLSTADGRGPVLVHALEGFSDAGHAIRLAAAHLKAALDTELVASFAIDELLDYRSRRPLMTFKTDHFTQYDDPELSLYALRDTAGTPFLLLAGMEPDLKWERFITAVRLLAERLGVRQTIGLGTVPMAVPHTRPVTLTAHSNNGELIADFTPWISEIQVPGSASNLLEYRMAQHGHQVVGFTVHVPHYLTQTDYPAAAQALLEQLAKTGSLHLPLKALTEAAEEVKVKVDEQVEASAEVAQVVTALERQYDAFIAAQEERSLLTRDEDLPSGDELGAEFERFLAQQAEKKFDDDDPT